MLVRYAFKECRRLKNADVAIISCNAQTTAIHLIQKLQQSCTGATAQSGRVYFPNADKLVLYLKGISVVDKTVGRSNHNISQPCHGCINPYCREWGGPLLRYSWSLSI